MLNAHYRTINTKIPRIKELKIPEIPTPEAIESDKLRFKGMTQAQIDSIKRDDNEKERFYTSFLGELSRISEYGHQGESLEIPPEEDIVTLYSFYDDITARNDSCAVFMKYHMIPMCGSISNQALHNKLFGKNGLYGLTLDSLKERLRSRINEYMATHSLDTLSADPADVTLLISLADSLATDANRNLVRLCADCYATGNAAYKEIKAMRALHGTSDEVESTTLLIKLIEMRLKTEQLWIEIVHFPNIDPEELWEIERMMRPGKRMGRYNESTLPKQLKIWIKNAAKEHMSKRSEQ
ncbi:hypothetical protein [Duncaniella muris]|uniref:hypothetical protein n=2 Tax=Bacteroidales TaxID=171549 RepID=UPI0025B721BB|nr:hypothetical protein [Duncaniella muris]